MPKPKLQKTKKPNAKAVLFIALAFMVVGTVAVSVSFAGRQSKYPYSISVPTGLWNQTVAATVDTDGIADTVYVQCYKPDFSGQWVYGASFKVENGVAQLGPFYANGMNNNGGVMLWGSPAEADCRATLGYVSRNGFGKWTPVTSTTFRVNAQ